MGREDIARACVEGLLCSLADAVSFLEEVSGSRAERLLFIGGGAKSLAVRTLAPSVLGSDIEVPEPGEYVALGAARQAAWALSGGADLPQWEKRPTTCYSGEHHPQVLEAYREARG
ncbi:FGGY family of carbohydrate kinases, C-terminal domain [Corynebacterium uterequi]|uniref:FGGY family of carbohydrate kinases, C-terminal domain n=1 Tax=Corynebacterium uterequi TaxID=1072256 RepID=A0A0G3HE94_9CORY|nr:FGGY family of carbohydrate kinases, C-terminal domain [Corynebacterium uterequi]